MISKTIPACFFPTSVVLVDDNRKYLQSIRLELNEFSAYYKLYDEPKKALEYLLNRHTPPLFSNLFALKEQSSLNPLHSLAIDIAAITDELNNPARFHESAVVVVDQMMPSLNGLMLCQELLHSPVKKILLTGEADETLAVKAFNTGLIHRFVRKDDPNFADTLNDAIQSLQHAHFIEQSQLILNSLEDMKPSALEYSEERYITFFHEILARHNIVEYYLVDKHGSYLLLDFEGNPSALIVSDKPSATQPYYHVSGNRLPELGFDIKNILSFREFIESFEDKY